MCVNTSRFTNLWSQNKQISMSNFHPLEVLGRGSDSKFQVGENLSYLL